MTFNDRTTVSPRTRRDLVEDEKRPVPAPRGVWRHQRRIHYSRSAAFGTTGVGLVGNGQPRWDSATPGPHGQPEPPKDDIVCRASPGTRTGRTVPGSVPGDRPAGARSGRPPSSLLPPLPCRLRRSPAVRPIHQRFGETPTCDAFHLVCSGMIASVDGARSSPGQQCHSILSLAVIP